MRQRPDQSTRGVARQLSIEIQSDDVTDVPERRPISGFYRKCILFIQQKAIKLEQFAAFTFPTHPDAFAGVISSMTVKMRKGSLQLVRVFSIQLLDKV